MQTLIESEAGQAEIAALKKSVEQERRRSLESEERLTELVDQAKQWRREEIQALSAEEEREPDRE